MKSVQISPHNWKTGITSAACRHFHIATKGTKFVEYLHPDFYDGELRKNLTTNEAPIINGYIEKPDGVGLGIDLNYDYLNKILKN